MATLKLDEFKLDVQWLNSDAVFVLSEPLN